MIRDVGIDCAQYLLYLLIELALLLLGNSFDTLPYSPIRSLTRPLQHQHSNTHNLPTRTTRTSQTHRMMYVQH